MTKSIVLRFRIAILDEPSSGLDPESRRELWNILLDMRKDHTIFITTHYMEEAEALADKIAIIAHGQLLCYGPSIQLKRRFETGYVLKLLTNDKFKQVVVMDTIREYVPDVILKSFVRPTLTLVLPYKYQDNFSRLLKILESNQAEFGITSISMTNSSLEDVFLKSDSTYNGKNKESLDEIDSSNYNRVREEPLHISGCQQFMAILYKKGIFMREQWVYWLMLFSFPIIAIVICFLSINYKLFTIGDTASKQIDLRVGQITPYGGDVVIWLQDNLPDKNNMQRVLHSIIEYENVSTKYLSRPIQEIENGKSFSRIEFLVKQFSNKISLRHFRASRYRTTGCILLS